MKKLYKYTGTVSGFIHRRNNPNALPFLDLVLCDLSDDDKAPIRIEALGGPADYIQEPKPGPMDSEQYHAWCAYNHKDEYRYTARKADA